MSVKIGMVQMACTADKEFNTKKCVQEIRMLVKKGAQIVALQELFNTLYFCDSEKYEPFNLAEPIPGYTINILSALAKELSVVLIVPFFQQVIQGVHFNVATVIDADGTLLGTYRKMHIPEDQGFNEKFYFTPGDTGYKVFNTKYAKISVLICWDQWYPEAARICALAGADIIFYPTAIGWAKSQDNATNQEQFDAWQTIQRSHAIANGVHIVAVNRTGVEQNGNMQFWGGSFVANPFGKILYQAPHTEEIAVVVEVNLSETHYYRTHWPFLRDRRIDSYSPILQRVITHPLL